MITMVITMAAIPPIKYIIIIIKAMIYYNWCVALWVVCIIVWVVIIKELLLFRCMVDVIRIVLKELSAA